jgi:hypothetical protein
MVQFVDVVTFIHVVMTTAALSLLFVWERLLDTRALGLTYSTLLYAMLAGTGDDGDACLQLKIYVAT